MQEITHNGFCITFKPVVGYTIYLPGKGGSLPEALTGSFTKPKEAMKAIDVYTQTKAAKKNDTTISD